MVGSEGWGKSPIFSVDFMKVHKQVRSPGVDQVGKTSVKVEELEMWAGFRLIYAFSGFVNHWVSLIVQLVKNPPAMRDTWVRSLGWEDPLEEGKATTPVFWPGEFHGLYSPWGSKELDRAKWLSQQYFAEETSHIQLTISSFEKCIIQWLLVHPQCCVAFITLWLQNIFITLKNTSYLLSGHSHSLSHSSPWQTSIHFLSPWIYIF